MWNVKYIELGFHNNYNNRLSWSFLIFGFALVLEKSGWKYVYELFIQWKGGIMKKEKQGIMSNSVLALIVLGIFVLVGISVAGEEEAERPEYPSFRLNGYIQARYTLTDEGTHEFSIKRARLGLKGEILENMNYKLQLDGVKSPILMDAQVEWSVIPKAKLTFGQFKIPFSIENLTSSSSLDNVNRTQTVEELCPGQDIGASGRDIGMAVSGKFSFLEYSVGIFNGSGINRRDTNEKKDLVGRLVFHPIDSLSVGVSQYVGDQRPSAADPHVSRDRTGVDVFFSRGQAFIKGEYIFAKDDLARRAGWYVRGGYSFIPDKLQAVVNYDSYDSDLDLDDNLSKVITLGLNWYFAEKTKLQINYENHKDDLAGRTDNILVAQFQAYF